MLDFSEMMGHHLLDHPLGAFGSLAVTRLMLMMWIAAVLSAVVVLLAGRAEGRLRTAIEAFIIFIREDILVPAMGHDAHDFQPYFLTLFVYIFFMNLLGLVPYGATATGNVSVTAGLSLMTLVLINLSGIRRHGFVHHFKNLVPRGVPLWVAPLVFAIELMGYFTKCLALTIRLFANMTAGHIVILVFLGLILMFGQSNPWAGLFVAPVSVLLALAIYLLEMLVAGIQAYVFTMLTAIFVGGALHPDH